MKVKRGAYDQLVADHEQRPSELPVDSSVHGSEDVARMRRKMLSLERKLRIRETHGREFLVYADLRSRLGALREQRYFDEGFLRGRLAGLGEDRRSGRAGRGLVRKLMEAALASDLEPAVAAEAALEIARALFIAAPAGRGRKGIGVNRILMPRHTALRLP